MKVLIIEDEKLAQEYLSELLVEIGIERAEIETTNSVKNSIKWLLKNNEPDLVFMDIDLGDGLCFEIFEVVNINCPIIFTTAYDQYAIKAFKVNSIDYLLKPVEMVELQQAINKYSRLKSSEGFNRGITNISKILSEKYKSRFIIKIGHRLRSLPSKNIMYFVSRDKATFAGLGNGREYLIDYSLDKLEDLLHPDYFFRINRKYVINYRAIQDITTYSNSRLKVAIKGATEREIIVARERVGEFKGWLDR